MILADFNLAKTKGRVPGEEHKVVESVLSEKS